MKIRVDQKSLRVRLSAEEWEQWIEKKSLMEKFVLFPNPLKVWHFSLSVSSLADPLSLQVEGDHFQLSCGHELLEQQRLNPAAKVEGGGGQWVVEKDWKEKRKKLS